MCEISRDYERSSRRSIKDIVEVSTGQPFPKYTQPKEIGCFSLDDQRKFCDDASQLRVFSSPALGRNCDLLEGYPQNYIERDPLNYERLDNLLRWVRIHRSAYQGELEKVDGHLPQKECCARDTKRRRVEEGGAKAGETNALKKECESSQSTRWIPGSLR
eukprot:m.377869 g.377869  ORF g.377869 m.377869 type:complete len:160 (+) comp20927_c1_seq4:356-835(+)